MQMSGPDAITSQEQELLTRVARAMDEVGYAYIRANERDVRIGKTAQT